MHGNSYMHQTNNVDDLKLKLDNALSRFDVASNRLRTIHTVAPPTMSRSWSVDPGRMRMRGSPARESYHPQPYHPMYARHHTPPTTSASPPPPLSSFDRKPERHVPIPYMQTTGNGYTHNNSSGLRQSSSSTNLSGGHHPHAAASPSNRAVHTRMQPMHYQAQRPQYQQQQQIDDGDETTMWMIPPSKAMPSPPVAVRYVSPGTKTRGNANGQTSNSVGGRGNSLSPSHTRGTNTSTTPMQATPQRQQPLSPTAAYTPPHNHQQQQKGPIHQWSTGDGYGQLQGNRVSIPQTSTTSSSSTGVGSESSTTWHNDPIAGQSSATTSGYAGGMSTTTGTTTVPTIGSGNSTPAGSPNMRTGSVSPPPLRTRSRTTSAELAGSPLRTFQPVTDTPIKYPPSPAFGGSLASPTTGTRASPNSNTQPQLQPSHRSPYQYVSRSPSPQVQVVDAVDQLPAGIQTSQPASRSTSPVLPLDVPIVVTSGGASIPITHVVISQQGEQPLQTTRITGSKDTPIQQVINLVEERMKICKQETAAVANGGGLQSTGRSQQIPTTPNNRGRKPTTKQQGQQPQPQSPSHSPSSSSLRNVPSYTATPLPPTPRAEVRSRSASPLQQSPPTLGLQRSPKKATVTVPQDGHNNHNSKRMMHTGTQWQQPSPPHPRSQQHQPVPVNNISTQQSHTHPQQQQHQQQVLYVNNGRRFSTTTNTDTGAESIFDSGSCVGITVHDPTMPRTASPPAAHPQDALNAYLHSISHQYNTQPPMHFAHSPPRPLPNSPPPQQQHHQPTVLTQQMSSPPINVTTPPSVSISPKVQHLSNTLKGSNGVPQSIHEDMRHAIQLSTAPTLLQPQNGSGTTRLGQLPVPNNPIGSRIPMSTSAPNIRSPQQQPQPMMRGTMPKKRYQLLAAAATIIQSRWRGYITRKAIQEYLATHYEQHRTPQHQYRSLRSAEQQPPQHIPTVTNPAGTAMFVQPGTYALGPSSVLTQQQQFVGHQPTSEHSTSNVGPLYPTTTRNSNVTNQPHNIYTTPIDHNAFVALPDRTTREQMLEEAVARHDTDDVDITPHIYTNTTLSPLREPLKQPPAVTTTASPQRQYNTSNITTVDKLRHIRYGRLHNSAATYIQAAWRGYLTRKHITGNYRRGISRSYTYPGRFRLSKSPPRQRPMPSLRLGGYHSPDLRSRRSPPLNSASSTLVYNYLDHTPPRHRSPSPPGSSKLGSPGSGCHSPHAINIYSPRGRLRNDYTTGTWRERDRDEHRRSRVYGELQEGLSTSASSASRIRSYRGRRGTTRFGSPERITASTRLYSPHRDRSNVYTSPHRNRPSSRYQSPQHNHDAAGSRSSVVYNNLNSSRVARTSRFEFSPSPPRGTIRTDRHANRYRGSLSSVGRLSLATLGDDLMVENAVTKIQSLWRGHRDRRRVRGRLYTTLAPTATPSSPTGSRQSTLQSSRRRRVLESHHDEVRVRHHSALGTVIGPHSPCSSHSSPTLHNRSGDRDWISEMQTILNRRPKRLNNSQLTNHSSLGYHDSSTSGNDISKSSSDGIPDRRTTGKHRDRQTSSSNTANNTVTITTTTRRHTPTTGTGRSRSPYGSGNTSSSDVDVRQPLQPTISITKPSSIRTPDDTPRRPLSRSKNYTSSSSNSSITSIRRTTPNTHKNVAFSTRGDSTSKAGGATTPTTTTTTTQKHPTATLTIPKSESYTSTTSNASSNNTANQVEFYEKYGKLSSEAQQSTTTGVAKRPDNGSRIYGKTKTVDVTTSSSTTTLFNRGADDDDAYDQESLSSNILHSEVIDANEDTNSCTTAH